MVRSPSRPIFVFVWETARLTPATSERLTITVAEGLTVSAISIRPTEASACYVLAHGAGHPFLEAVASELGDRGIASLRYNFPFMERRSKRPDPPALAHATVRAAVMKAREIAPELTLVAGGKSFGGRMTSQAQASSPLAAVRGLVFLAISASCGQATVRGTRSASFRRSDSDAFPPGHTRRAGRPRPPAPGVRASGRARNLGRSARRRSLLPRAGSDRSQRRGCPGQTSERPHGLDPRLLKGPTRDGQLTSERHV
jgi:hypothetical protein